MITANTYTTNHKQVNQAIIQTVYEKIQNLSVEQANEVLTYIDFIQFKSSKPTANDEILDKKQYAIEKLNEIGKQAKIGDVVSPI
ncbi:MAG: hypothetical protein KGV51_08270 [Moraxellaceae bacterium]|nr:hypothetical protein [Moraxellaceae bacterium]